MSNRLGLAYFYTCRAIMVLACIILISGFLYLPHWYFRIQGRSITVFTWADVFDLEQIAKFEIQSGIKVNLIYYDNCEELITKLELSKGRDYDLLFLADCNLNDLIQMRMLASWDKSRLNFWSELEPRLLDRAYDPGNIYTVPYSWDVYGIGVNLQKLQDLPFCNSWKVIFDQNLKIARIGMVDDALSAFAIATQYLYGNVSKLDQAQICAVRQLLMEQKRMVEVYTGTRGDYLLSTRSVPAVVSQSACIRRAMIGDSQIKFLVPSEGGFISTENFALMNSSAKADLVYEFVNFMFEPQVMRNYVGKTNYLPARRDILHELNLDYLGGQDYLLDPDNFEKFSYFKYVISRKEICRLWIEVKAS